MRNDRVYAEALGRSQEFSRAAVSAPSPRSGEVMRTTLPDTFDGIRFQIGRMGQYVKDAVHDPTVQRQAEDIQGTYGRMIRDTVSMNGAKLSQSDERVLKLQAIDEWCREHARYVNDPPNIEVIQTPGRMVKQTKVPPEVIRYIMAPFYDAFAKANPSFHVESYEPPPTYCGDCDELVTEMQGLCACTFRKPSSMNGPSDNARLFFQFGGNKGTLHHVWAKVLLDETEFHTDHTEPGYRLGDHSEFDAYEDLEVTV
jgi:hypothetical protein